MQPNVFVDHEWRSNKNCLKTSPRRLVDLRKRATEQVLLFAHASLEVLEDLQFPKVFPTCLQLPRKWSHLN